MGIHYLRNPGEPKYWRHIYKIATEVEKWFNTPNDYDLWRGGFGEDFSLYMAIDDVTDCAIGCASAVDYRLRDGTQLVTLTGMLCVDPAYRGQGIGLHLSRLVMDKEVGYKNKSLTAVQEMVPKYAKLFGFDKIPADNKFDIEIDVSALSFVDQPNFPKNVHIKTIETADWSRILEFDHKMSRISTRDKFIQLYCSQPNSFQKIAIDTENNDVVGICNIVSNPAIRRLYVGPFYAATTQIADALLTQVLRTIPDLSRFDHVGMAFYESSKTLEMNILKRLPESAIEKCRHFVQFTDKIIELPKDKIYSVTEDDVTYL